jgi:protoheme IX farnesyltransferase
LQIFVYSLLLAAVSLAPVITGLGGTVYAFAAAVLNVGFLALAFKVWRSRAGEKEDAADEASLYAVAQGDRAARNLFLYSILYLFALFGVLAAEGLLRSFA